MSDDPQRHAKDQRDDKKRGPIAPTEPDPAEGADDNPPPRPGSPKG